MFFCKLHILLNHEHIRQDQQANNRDDSFEKRHFDEGRPCGEPPCTSLVKRSRMLMQKRLLFPGTSYKTIRYIAQQVHQEI